MSAANEALEALVNGEVAHRNCGRVAEEARRRARRIKASRQDENCPVMSPRPQKRDEEEGLAKERMARFEKTQVEWSTNCEALMNVGE